MRAPRRHESGRGTAGIVASIAAIVAVVTIVLATTGGTALAHNITASGKYSCDGGWSYTASYVNGGGGGSSDNRLVIVDVNIGGNVLKQYHYFDTLTSHPAPPSGFTVIDHPTMTTYQLFALGGATSPITATGSIKMYDGGSTSQPSSDPAYKRYLPSFSLNPIPGLASATNCSTRTSTPTFTSTSTVTSTPTPTATSTATPTFTPSGPPFADLALTVDKTSVNAGIDQIALSDIPIDAISHAGEPASAKIGNVSFRSSPLSSVPLSSIPLSSVAVGSSPLSSVPLSSVPITRPGGWEAVLEGTSLQGVPLQNVTVAQLFSLNPPAAALAPNAINPLMLSQVDLGATAMRSLSMVSVALGFTPLSSIPVSPPATNWCEELASVGFSCASIGKDASNIGSATLLELNIAGAPLSSIPLSSIPLSSVNIAGSPLSSVPLSSVPLSSVPLSSIPLSSVPLSSIAVTGAPLSSVPLSSIGLPAGAASWCDVFAGAGHTCASLAIDENSPLGGVVAALSSAGVSLSASPLSSVPLSSIPLSSVPLSSVPLSSVPLSSVAIGGAPLSSVPLSSINIGSSFLAGVPLSSVPLSSVSINRSPLSSIPLSSVAAVINCGAVNCATGTLGDAADAGAILQGATLGSIAGALGSFTLGDVRVYGSGTVQDVLDALGANAGDVTYFLSFLYGNGAVGDVSGSIAPNLGAITLGQIMLALLIRSDYPWEDLPLDALTSSNVPGTGTLSYHATFTYGGGAPTASLEIVLPQGFHVEPGTSLLTTTGGTATIADPAVSGPSVAWTLQNLPPGPVALDFRARPGLKLGIQSASMTLGAQGLADLSIDNQAPVTVLENLEPNDDPATAPLISPDVLYISHISSSSDRDFFRIAATSPGSRISVLLSHQAQDNDLALFRPGAADLRPSTGLPLQSLPLDDAGPDVLQNAPPPQTLQDIKLAALPLSSISANRGTAGESVAALSLDGSGFYTIEAAGYNGASDDDPYVLRVKVSAPPPLPVCAARTFPFAGVGTAGVTPGALSRDVNTLFIVNQTRLGDMYGAGAAAGVMSSLNTLAGRSDLGVRGAVIPVEGNAAVANAYAAWDANPCSPDAANGVVAAINALVDGYRATLADLQNIVLVGSDDIVPLARIPDLTRISNESDYAGDALAVSGNNSLVASFVTSNVLSDNPYADFHPTPWLNRQLFVPEIAVGRLVETPDEITAQVNQFILFSGKLDPKTALTTGYDFLSDGAAKVAGSADAIVGAANSTRLINDAWTSADLRAAFDQKTPAPALDSINAHFDHYRLLPGAGNTSGDESDLYTSANIARAPADPRKFAGAVIFSMGCHSGLNVSNLLAPLPNADQARRLLDWPQAFSDQGAAVYVANTGYGYGDTDLVAYSEQLMALFAQRVKSNLTVGQALTFAKQAYFGDLVQYQAYDEKVLAEATFYGLPMFRIGSPPGPPLPPAAPAPLATDPFTGIDVVPFSAAPVFTKIDLGSKGSYYAIKGNARVTSGRPIQPVMDVDLPQAPDGKTARGIIITSLESADESGFDPVFADPSVDASVPERISDETFPSSIHNLTTFDTPAGQQQRVTLMPAQYIHEPGDPDGIGTERRYTSVVGLVTYSDSADVTPPTIFETHAANTGSLVTFVVDAEDDIADNVKRVLVVFKPASASQWTSLDLAHTTGTTRWTSSVPATGAVQFSVYAVDGAGNVALSTNKGAFHHTVAASLPNAFSLSVSGNKGGGGWYFDAQVTLNGDPAVQFEARIDGAPFQPYTEPFAVTGDGIHFVEARGSDGSNGSITVPIDTSAPAITIVTPPQNATYGLGQQVLAKYFCTDAGSGVASCTGDVPNGSPFSTSSVGPATFDVSASDTAGNTSSGAAPYAVNVCTNDTDCDTVFDASDNCPNIYNPDQANRNAETVRLPKPFPPRDDITNPIGDFVGDACDPDIDHDGIPNALEVTMGLSPYIADTDGDRTNDGTEVRCGSDPLDALSTPTGPDADHDGLPDACEQVYGTDPNNVDTDADGILDGVEVRYWMTNPLSKNSDGDGCTDNREIASVNDDYKVNSTDQLIIAKLFGSITPQYGDLDTNGDGKLNSTDMLIVSRNFGNCQP